MIEKIPRAEIERLKNGIVSEALENSNDIEAVASAKYKTDVLKEVVHILDTLEEEDKYYFYCQYGGILPTCSDCKRNLLNSRISKEQVQGWLSPDTHSKRCNSKIPLEEEPVNLEKELEGFVKSEIPYGECGYRDFIAIARHFYELGCRRTAEKYDEIEYNRQRAEESVPNDLEEAAEEYSKERAEGHVLYDWVHAFIAGAKWQKEQMMEEAVEGYIAATNESSAVLALPRDSFKKGDKVRIIIVKED